MYEEAQPTRAIGLACHLNITGQYEVKEHHIAKVCLRPLRCQKALAHNAQVHAEGSKARQLQL